jgi:hypothetical protein
MVGWRKRPRLFGLAVLGVWTVVVATIAGLSTIGVEEEMPRNILLLLNGVGFVASAFWFYRGGSLIADPKQKVTYQRYERSTGYVGGQRVDISTPGERVTTRLKPGTGYFMLVVGLVFWGIFGVMGIIGAHSGDETEADEVDAADAPVPTPTPTKTQSR